MERMSKNIRAAIIHDDLHRDLLDATGNWLGENIGQVFGGSQMSIQPMAPGEKGKPERGLVQKLSDT
jgi:hypothetical protein